MLSVRSLRRPLVSGTLSVLAIVLHHRECLPQRVCIRLRLLRPTLCDVQLHRHRVRPLLTLPCSVGDPRRALLCLGPSRRNQRHPRGTLFLAPLLRLHARLLRRRGDNHLRVQPI